MSELALTIDRLAVGGAGVARDAHGKVVFVTGALPGEIVRARVLEERRRFSRAELSSLVASSSDRRPLDCRHESRDGCGGCGFRHVARGRALGLKTAATRSELAKLAAALEWPVATEHNVEQHDGGRCRVRLHCRGGRLGLFRRGTRELVAIPRCHALDPTIVAAIGPLEQLVAVLPPRSQPATVLVECSQGGLFAHWSPPPPASFVAELKARVEESPFRGVRWATGEQALAVGEAWMEERASDGSLVLRRLVGTFGQAHPAANQHLRQVVGSILGTRPRGRVLDLFAGSGNLSLVAARHADQVTAVELDPDAIASLSASARARGLSNVTWQRRDLRGGLGPDLTRPGWEVIILDPPRTGARQVMADVRAAEPDEIIYVSCWPTRLARDAVSLSERYRVMALHAFDMFPRTPHLEMLAHLRRVDG